MIFQDYKLLEDRTVYDNVALPLQISGHKNNLIKDKVFLMLKKVGIEEKYKSLPLKLSGGERQRVSIARALVKSPDLILADEPTGNLDHHASDQLIELIRKLNQEFNQTFVIVTHSQRVAGRLDRVVELVDGKVNTTRQNLVI